MSILFNIKILIKLPIIHSACLRAHFSLKISSVFHICFSQWTTRNIDLVRPICVRTDGSRSSQYRATFPPRH